MDHRKKNRSYIKTSGFDDVFIGGHWLLPHDQKIINIAKKCKEF